MTPDTVSFIGVSVLCWVLILSEILFSDIEQYFLNPVQGSSHIGNSWLNNYLSIRFQASTLVSLTPSGLIPVKLKLPFTSSRLQIQHRMSRTVERLCLWHGQSVNRVITNTIIVTITAIVMITIIGIIIIKLSGTLIKILIIEWNCNWNGCQGIYLHL